MIDNALWGFVQPEGGWLKYPEMMRLAKAQAKERHATSNAGSFQTKFEADREASVETDPVLQLVNGPVVDMFTTGEPDKSSLVSEFGRRAFVDDICFGGEDFDSCLTTLDRLLTRFTTCRISISFTKSIFCQPKVDFFKRGMQSFFGALNYYSRFIQDFAVYGAALYQLKEEDFGPRGDLSVAQRAFDALQTKVTEAPIMKNFDRTKEAHVMLFAHEWALSTTLMKEHEDKLHSVRFLGRVLKESEMNYHPAEKEAPVVLLVAQPELQSRQEALEVLPKARTTLEQDSLEPTFRAVLVTRLLDFAECLNGQCRPDEIHRDGYEVMSAGTRIEGEDGTTCLQTLMFPCTPWDQGFERPVNGSVQAFFWHRVTRGEIRKMRQCHTGHQCRGFHCDKGSCGVVISGRSLRPSASKDETTFNFLKLQTLGHVTESDLEAVLIINNGSGLIRIQRTRTDGHGMKTRRPLGATLGKARRLFECSVMVQQDSLSSEESLGMRSGP
ncbi:hypothetical protein PC110_g9951 [Phytophthora cactorum]|uniref:Reverse transcriptase/retrotransposon-derived protein RNase H-like domain-containing protein n=1 Tax=Phytophthora cactorum TaxID=29920 RepID=A0A329SA20_9STRA|nr:hypothetical protein PC110_g9951 [Phytophthora cactorum]